MRAMPKSLPVGSADFVHARSREGFHYVDKTGLIGRLLRSNADALVFCRPRRFAKTLNLTMLREFLALPGPDVAPWAPDPSPANRY